MSIRGCWGRTGRDFSKCMAGSFRTQLALLEAGCALRMDCHWRQTRGRAVDRRLPVNDARFVSDK